ncbi:9523_t:CDS:2 [Ambispora leptoticha]|uniref:9523_t:CDS:1 n=1 Tax=Ambispora leptoticha TaxID=144679 RepID=A0A9N9FH09_9GLOM|nr:9523_t:CDS:2 [Ambispora leptoticha]
MPYISSIYYILELVQHPFEGQIDSFVEPAPTLKLTAYNALGAINPDDIQISNLIAVAYIINLQDDNNEEANSICNNTNTRKKSASKKSRTKFNKEKLYDYCIETPYKLMDLQNRNGIYFVFSELNIPKCGMYKIRYRVFDVTSPRLLTFDGEKLYPLDEIESNQIAIYSTEFPIRKNEPNALSIWLNGQITWHWLKLLDEKIAKLNFVL